MGGDVLAAGHDDVVRPPQDGQARAVRLPAAQVARDEQAVRPGAVEAAGRCGISRGAEVRRPVRVGQCGHPHRSRGRCRVRLDAHVAVGQDGPGQDDAVIRGEAHAHLRERDAVVDAAAGGLAHPVRADDRDPGVRGALQQARGDRGTAQQDRGGAGQGAGGRGHLEDPDQLGGDQRRVDGGVACGGEGAGHVVSEDGGIEAGDRRRDGGRGAGQQRPQHDLEARDVVVGQAQVPEAGAGQQVLGGAGGGDERLSGQGHALGRTRRPGREEDEAGSGPPGPGRVVGRGRDRTDLSVALTRQEQAGTAVQHGADGLGDVGAAGGCGRDGHGAGDRPISSTRGRGTNPGRASGGRRRGPRRPRPSCSPGASPRRRTPAGP